MQLRHPWIRQVSNQTKELPIEKKAWNEEECGEETGFKASVWPQAEGSVCRTPRGTRAEAGDVINQLFQASKPHPHPFFFFKYLPCVKNFIFMGILTAACEVKIIAPLCC